MESHGGARTTMGSVDIEDLLDVIFRDFCISKEAGVKAPARRRLRGVFRVLSFLDTIEEFAEGAS